MLKFFFFFFSVFIYQYTFSIQIRIQVLELYRFVIRVYFKVFNYPISARARCGRRFEAGYLNKTDTVASLKRNPSGEWHV